MLGNLTYSHSFSGFISLSSGIFWISNHSLTSLFVISPPNIAVTETRWWNMLLCYADGVAFHVIFLQVYRVFSSSCEHIFRCLTYIHTITTFTLYFIHKRNTFHLFLLHHTPCTLFDLCTCFRSDFCSPFLMLAPGTSLLAYVSLTS